MTQIILQSLRKELNRERAYVRQTRINVNRGVEVSPITMICAGIRWHNTAVLKKAIRELKTVKKPDYKWIKP